MPFFLPKGAFVYNSLVQFIRELYDRYDYAATGAGVGDGSIAGVSAGRTSSAGSFAGTVPGAGACTWTCGSPATRRGKGGGSRPASR